MKAPLITIGITCFDAEDTIARAIESAQAQNYPHFEIIVVDDASKDNSVQIVEEMKKADQRIGLYHHKENQGVAAARNTIIQYAKGEYIAFFDDDDESVPSRLEKQHGRLLSFQREHPGVPILCYSNLNFVQNKNSGKISLLKGVGHRAPEPHGKMVMEFFLLNNKKAGHVWGIFASCALFASKDVLKKFGYDPRFRRSEDCEIGIRVALEGGCFISVDEYLVTQYHTKALDKTDEKCLLYNIMLWQKHRNKVLYKKNILKTINYCGAACLQYSWFCNIKNRRWRRLISLLFAQVLLPKKHLLKAVSRRVDEYGWRVFKGL